MQIIYIAIGAACIYLLQRVLYAKFWNKNLTVAIRFSQDAIYEQEEGELCETIVNQKWLPLPMLRVKFETDRHLDFMQEGNIAVTDRCYKSDIFAVMMCQKIVRRLKFKGKRRGFYAISQIAVDSTDIFMEKHLAVELPCNACIYVYPGQADVRRLLIPFQKMMGDILTRRYTYEDPFEFQGIRPYEPFDSMRDVNWKATARTGELRTNLHGYTVRQEVCLLLNLESESMIEYPQLREESIRIANSLSEMFLSQGIPVGIYSNAKDLLSGKELHIKAGANRQHLTLIRESLARLDASQEMEPFAVFVRQRLSKVSENVLYVCISYSQRSEVAQVFTWLASRSFGSYWLVPLHSWMEWKVASVQEGIVMRWEVKQNAAG
ncbi:MAG: DUF58 domain-containing protein [Eubacterium sp.]|nr:DUF58 domain-containing protein [Eubacterium sp.]